ncbi:MAG: Uma2 family endonuclease [Planctomycetota bacterium]|jgi:Uma2 family endonuclease
MPSHIQTAEQLLDAGDIGRCELIRGELAMMQASGGLHGRITMRIGRALDEFISRHDLGTVLAAETGFVLARDPDTVRAPDAAFVRSGRTIDDRFIEGAPELAVEVLSPSDRPGYVSDKVAEWLESGAEAVWVVDPREQTVDVHVAAREPKTLSVPDTLRGGEVLPGFELELTTLFR